MELTALLEQFGFNEKEAKVYLACLELGQAPVSSIARNAGEQRVTTYATLKKLIARGVAQSFIKGNATFYSVIDPERLYHSRETKFATFKDKLPELVALGNKYDNKPKVQFYEGIEGLKYVIEQVVIMDQLKGDFEPILAFLGTKDIDPRFQNYLMQEYVPRRLQYTVPTKVIIPQQSLSWPYSQYNEKQHDTIIIDTPTFDIANEIILHGKDKVSLLMYSSAELSALVITSASLYDGLRGLFNLIWEAYKR